MKETLFFAGEKYPLIKKDPQLIKLKMTPGGHPVWMWRDDPGDFAFGGNKVRFYEYLIPKILREAPDVLLTTGSLYSNHIRVTAEVGKLLGIGVVLLITGDAPEGGTAAYPNVAAAERLGADIRYIGGFAALLKANGIADEMRRETLPSGREKKVFFVPNAGHAPTAVRAYAEVLAGALMRLDGFGVRPERVFLPTASGTTLAGLLCGSGVLSSMGVQVPSVTGFAVGNSPAGAVTAVKKLISRASGFIDGLQDSPAPEVLTYGDCEYGRLSDELSKFRRRVSDDEGILLDPTYNAVAFAGTIDALEHDPGESPVLYINTGGYTGTPDSAVRDDG